MNVGLAAIAGVSALVAGVRYVLTRRKVGAMGCLHEEPCPCFGQGYAAGKDKAHFELRHHTEAGHAGGCGCEPCRTLRAIVVPVLLREAEAAHKALCDVCRD